jgi:hypothetical protein
MGYAVRARWDEASQTWWTDGEDIPGLCCQAATFEELAELVFALAPDLLRANGLAPEGAVDIPVSVHAERRGMARLVA